MNAVSRVFRRLLEWATIILMLLLTVVVVVGVLYRLAGNSLSWYDEVAAVLLAWITYYAAALAALRRRHIGFDGVLITLPLPARMAAVVIGELLVIGFFVALAWAGYRILTVLEGVTLVSLTWVPVQLTQSVIPIGAILFVVAEILSLPGYWRATMAGISLDHDELVGDGHGA